MKQILLIALLGTSVSVTAQIPDMTPDVYITEQTLYLSFDDDLRQMQQGNRSLKICLLYTSYILSFQRKEVTAEQYA